MEQAKRAADVFKSIINLRFFFGCTDLLQESLVGYMKSQYYTTWRLTDTSSPASLSNGYRSGVPPANRFYSSNKTITHIQYKPRSMPNSTSPLVQVDGLTLYPLPQIFCRLLHSHIFNTDYQPLPRKATTMAEYLCEG